MILSEPLPVWDGPDPKLETPRWDHWNGHPWAPRLGPSELVLMPCLSIFLHGLKSFVGSISISLSTTLYFERESAS